MHSGFLFQTPLDGGSFCSYAAGVTVAGDGRKIIRGIAIHDKLNVFPRCVPEKWKEDVDVALVLLPLEFLQEHVYQTGKQLADLISRVEDVERIVKRGAEIGKLKEQIQNLHSCNTDLIKLERRWRFQSDLSSAIVNFFNRYKSESSNLNSVTINRLHLEAGSEFQINQLGKEKNVDATSLQNDIDFIRMNTKVCFQKRLASASKYDLDVLSRRIENQFTAVCILLGGGSAELMLERCSILSPTATRKLQSISQKHLWTTVPR